MKKLKIKVFLLEHKIIKYILLIIIITLISTKFSINIPTTNDTTIIGVVGTLLGAIVGGLFSLIGSIYVNNKQITSNSEIKRKNIIYKPLYDELLEVRKIIEKENPYPRYINFEKGFQAIFKCPEINAWERICSDSRILDTPNNLRRHYSKYLESVNKYIDLRETVDDSIQNVINNVLKEKFDTECTLINLSSSISKDILMYKNNKNLIKQYYESCLKEKRKITDEDWANAYDEVVEKCEDLEEIKKVRSAYNNWIKTQNEIIELLELLILEINIKYEKQRR